MRTRKKTRTRISLRTRRRKNLSQTKRTHLSPSVLPIGPSCLSPGVLPMAFMRHTPSHPHRQTDGPKHNGPSGTTHSIALPQAPIKLARQSAASHSQDVREGPIRSAVTLIRREASLLPRHGRENWGHGNCWEFFKRTARHQEDSQPDIRSRFIYQARLDTHKQPGIKRTARHQEDSLPDSLPDSTAQQQALLRRIPVHTLQPFFAIRSRFIIQARLDTNKQPGIKRTARHQEDSQPDSLSPPLETVLAKACTCQRANSVSLFKPDSRAMKTDSIARYQECRLSLRMQTCTILDRWHIL